VLASGLVTPIGSAPSRRASLPAVALSWGAADAVRRRGPSSAAVICLAVVIAACSLVSTSPPAPTPADFPGITATLAANGIGVSNVVSGDPGCEDRTLAPEAIRLDAEGRDQAEPVTVYLYIFRNRDAFERRRTDVDVCARAFVSDPQSVASVETSPFVLAGQGPWAPGFAAALRAGLSEAAGTGG
jgi:hypothetical protein